MSTSAQVRTAWNTLVFSDVALTAISDIALTYEITDATRKEISNFRTGQEVNFFNYLVTRNVREGVTGGAFYDYEVEVNYYREKDVAGLNYAVCIDVFETVTERVLNALGSTWGATVDFSRLPENQPEITDLEIGGKPCWRASQRYTATKFVTI